MLDEYYGAPSGPRLKHLSLSALVSIMRKRPHASSPDDNAPGIANKSGRKSGVESSDHESREGIRRLNQENPTSSSVFRWLILICFNVIPLCILAAGMVLCFTKLYTAGECEMTYSRRTFFEIPVRADNDNSTYKMWKFVDQRDLRGRQTKDDFCRSVPIVLYVPGHYGSYEQSRSIGAHGTRLTGRLGGTLQERTIVKALADTMTQTNDHVASLDYFFYDVYAVDFQEEGSAFHGAILQRQANFIAAAIMTLTSTCGRSHLFIVAHSFGGISSKLAVANDPVVWKSVAAIITLATPHAFPIWTWEPHIFVVYRDIESKPMVPIISISGGFRDEMIPPDACYAGAKHVSIHAADISKCTIGMDHRAIVWCHNVLSEVRSLLYVLESEVKESQQAHMAEAAAAWFQSSHDLNVSQYDYLDRTKAVKSNLMVRHRTSTQSSNGWTLQSAGFDLLSGHLMEIGLLHNIPILIELFATNGAIRYTFPALTPFVTVSVTILMNRWFAATNRNCVSFTVFAVLSLIANTVYSVFYWFLNNWSRSRLRRHLRLHLVVGAGCLALFGGCWVGLLVTTPSLRVVATIASSLFCALMLLVPNQSQQTKRFGTWLFPLLIPMVMGDWFAIDCHSSWNMTLIMAPLCLRLFIAKDLSVEGPVTKLFRWILIVHGVWDNLSSRHNNFVPVFASLLLYIALFDLCMHYGLRQNVS